MPTTSISLKPYYGQISPRKFFIDMQVKLAALLSKLSMQKKDKL